MRLIIMSLLLAGCPTGDGVYEYYITCYSGGKVIQTLHAEDFFRLDDGYIKAWDNQDNIYYINGNCVINKRRL